MTAAKTFITDITVRATVAQAHMKCVETLRRRASASVIGLAMIRQAHPDREELRALEAWWRSIDEQAAAEMRRIKSQIEG